MPIPATLGWYDVPSSLMRAVVPPGGVYGGTSLGNPQYIVWAWNSGVMDTLRNRLIIWGGGHGDYSGNEIYAFDLGPLTFSRLTNPGLPAVTGAVGGSPEGIVPIDPGGTQANSRHTYGGLEYMANVDKMFALGGALSWGGGGSTELWCFDLATNTWERRNPAGTRPSSSQQPYWWFCAYDPNTGKVFFHDTLHLSTYSYASNTWTRVADETFLPNIGLTRTAVIDPVRKKLVVVGGNDGNGNPQPVWIYDISPGSNYVRTVLNTTGGAALEGSQAPGLAYDPVSGNIIGWAGGGTVYSLNLNTNVWTPITYSGGPGQPLHSTHGHWRYSPASGVFVSITSIDASVQTLRLAPTSTQITSFQLTSTQTGTLPFSIGLPFKKGDVTGVPTLSAAEHQIVVKRRWNDNSVKHAIASGQLALTANVPSTVIVLNSASGPSGTNLTATDIQNANPSASVQVGSVGTVTLASLLASPFRTWISGPEMVECHYRANVGADPLLSVWFHVRLYKAGRIWVRAIVENGYKDVASANKTYVPTVIIGGTTVYSNGGATLSHYANTRWSAEGWAVGANPAVTPKHDSQYLTDTKLLPNYWKRNPSAATLNAMLQTYTPMSNGNHEPGMGAAGYQPGIGLLPKWDALYVTSTDPRAYRSVLANASSLNSYPIVWRNSATQLPVLPSSNPAALNSYGWTAGPLTWEMNHSPSAAYLAYMVTGDYWYYETMLMNGSLIFLLLNNVGGRGAGVNCVLTAETRGTAWNIRSLSQLAALFPTGDAVAAEYQTLISNNINHWQTIIDGMPGPRIGDVYEYGFGFDPGLVSPWQQHWFDQSVGMGWDLEPLSNMAIWQTVRDFLYKWPVGMAGDGSGYCFSKASQYTIKISDSTQNNPQTFYTTWAQVYAATFPSVPACGSNLLEGGSGGDPAVANGYWANYLPAIAYATEHGAAGAAAAWARLTGASNWATFENAGFADEPEWGIVPRSVTPPTATPPAAPTGLRRRN